jgi:UDP-N-acetylmuramoylalanine--D-glutamate ligase
VIDNLQNKRIVILGFGREGRAMLNYLLKYHPGQAVHIADANPGLVLPHELRANGHITLSIGIGYLERLDDYDMIIKTPGIPLDTLKGKADPTKITSQTDIFLRMFAKQVAGITGTKGKSTTSSLLYHLLRQQSDDTLLLGNIGVPAFEMIDRIGPGTRVVFELSSHQLEDIHISPTIAILLNIFEEHLDHYPSYKAYQQAKLNIARHQREGDVFIYHADNIVVAENLEVLRLNSATLPFTLSKRQGSMAWWEDDILHAKSGKGWVRIPLPVSLILPGDHNRLNVAAAVIAAMQYGATPEMIAVAFSTFKPLPHRLEYLGCINGRHFYNDSIATIPEAAMAAIRTLGQVDTLLAGGFNRGIQYQAFIDFLAKSEIGHLLLTGEAGQLIRHGLLNSGFKGKVIFFRDFADMARQAIQVTPPGGICLLSPAASSYDAFKNFEERGSLFRTIVTGRD